MASRQSFSAVLALVLAATVALAALYAAKLVGVPPVHFLPPAFVTDTVVLALCIAVMGLLSQGHLHLFGLTKGTYQFSPFILLWILPTAVLSIASAVAPHAGPPPGPASELTKLQIVVFVWVYASIAEELLTRGLLQTLLSWNTRFAAVVICRLSMPVLVSGLFFGAMHLVLFKSMGPAAVPVILLAVFLGLVAARYRERTGSLLPAIIIHVLFNAGGTLPLWAIQWLRG
jgi:membrane protease YdiL (CAAX protease family)